MPGRQGLPRQARLLTGPQFSRVFATRKARSNRFFTIHYAPAEFARLGMAVSRRVSNRAVVRNRIRRQIRESFRHQRTQLKTMDYVVVARPAAAGLTPPELRDALDQLWQRFSVDP
ncbi:ribonuclease P protein component [Wenzhouxiangella sp. AB-CW3]|uniref:ribonuclease P protein component n=1 Tax=Wenzhouxiangella sp. AB-CW3 TaxID=2771012 RepID=UPI00168ADC1D|nr:ribonuclease P protein component [Wenzhouxiangella sp. AB-CW3]QOC22601.1 ribonuclease P protein component [Wenzhouxiangella sp. AB-CW3]